MKDQNGGASDTLRGFLSDVKASRLRCCFGGLGFLARIWLSYFPFLHNF